jgi:hypothetical protein
MCHVLFQQPILSLAQVHVCPAVMVTAREREHRYLSFSEKFLFFYAHQCIPSL